LYETVQIDMSRVAADAVDVDHLKLRARDHDIPNASAETSYCKAGGRCGVTSSIV
jgi:hypothetical protein